MSEQQPDRHRRPVAVVTGVLQWLHGAALLLAVPVIAFSLLWSGWEGGDQDMKHRLQAWAGFGIYGNLAAAVALGVAGWLLLKRAAVAPRAVMVATALLAFLGAGWAWVERADLWADPATLGLWLALTGFGPAVAAVSLMLEGRRRPISVHPRE